MYAWGSNSRGQLGIPVKTTEKKVEFISIGHEQPPDDDDAISVPDARSQSVASSVVSGTEDAEDIAFRPLV